MGSENHLLCSHKCPCGNGELKRWTSRRLLSLCGIEHDMQVYQDQPVMDFSAVGSQLPVPCTVVWSITYWVSSVQKSWTWWASGPFQRLNQSCESHAYRDTHTWLCVVWLLSVRGNMLAASMGTRSLCMNEGHNLFRKQSCFRKSGRVSCTDLPKC